MVKNLFRSRLIPAAFSLVAGLMASAADFTWSGAAGDHIVTNRMNWVDAGGLPPEAAPTREDTLIFDLASPLTVTNFSRNADYEYRKLVLRGSANLTFYGYGDCPTNTSMMITATGVKSYAFYLPLEIVNETASSRISFNGRDPRVAPGTAKSYSTNLVNVVNAAASVYNGNHIQSHDAYHRTLKIGQGTLYPFGGHNYDTRDMLLKEGTVFYSAHAMRTWYNCHLTFLGDAPGKTFNFQYKKQSGTYSLNGVALGHEYWDKYIFHVPLVEEGVTTTDHVLRSDNGADLVFTNGVTDMTFTGRIRGSLNFWWSPTNATPQTFTYSRGESDTTGTLRVLLGRMAMTQGARFTALSNLIVAAGAELNLAPGTLVRTEHATVGGADLVPGLYTTVGTAGNGLVTGGGVLQVGESFVVPYADATKTATPLDFSTSGLDAEAIAPLLPLPLTLSEKMCISNVAAQATNRVAVARFPAAAGITAEMLSDASPKTYGLPTTWFELETAEGVTTAYLVSRPVISPVYYKDESGGSPRYYICEDADFWSDGLLPHSGADYYINRTGVYHTGGSTSSASLVFGGESLTVSHALFYPKVSSFEADLRFDSMQDSNDDVFYPERSGTTTYRGTIRGLANCSPLTIRSGGSAGDPLVVYSDISSDAPMRIKYTWSTSLKSLFSLLGDNRGVKGKIELMANVNGTKGYWQQLEVTVANGNALGGDMAEFTQDGIRMTGFPKLIATGDADFAAVNRGWLSVNGLQAEVAEGRRLAVFEPYRCQMQYSAALTTYIPQRCAVEKTGAGTLMLQQVIPVNSGYNPIAGDGTNNLVRVKEGGVGPLAADAFDRCRMDFADGTAIVVAPANGATAECGLRLLDEAPVFAEGAKVRLVPDMDGFAADTAFTAAFLTVPAATLDLTATLRPAAFTHNGRRWLGRRVVKDSVTVAGQECTRYSARFSVAGMHLLLK